MDNKVLLLARLYREVGYDDDLAKQAEVRLVNKQPDLIILAKAISKLKTKEART